MPILNWLRTRRRSALLENPFPDAWRTYLTDNMDQYGQLSTEERDALEKMVQVFVAEKNWEGCGGLEMTDEIRVTVAGQACLLILEHDHDLYRNVQSILVYPSTVVTPDEEKKPILGQAHRGGPVILVWDATLHGGRNARDGRNLVYHEFAHKLDMLDGAADGTPPLEPSQYDSWVRACAAAYEDLKKKSERNKKTFLDDYGATNEAEFFAVATEFFFEKSKRMKRELPELYAVLKEFFAQDPAARGS